MCGLSPLHRRTWLPGTPLPSGRKAQTLCPCPSLSPSLSFSLPFSAPPLLSFSFSVIFVALRCPRTFSPSPSLSLLSHSLALATFYAFPVWASCCTLTFPEVCCAAFGAHAMPTPMQLFRLQVPLHPSSLLFTRIGHSISLSRTRIAPHPPHTLEDRSAPALSCTRVGILACMSKIAMPPAVCNSQDNSYY